MKYVLGSSSVGSPFSLRRLEVVIRATKKDKLSFIVGQRPTKGIQYCDNTSNCMD
jgi:hypothetical protein